MNNKKNKMKTIYQILAVLIILVSFFNSKSQCSKPISQHCFNGDAKDNSGSGNNGTANGATLATGRFAKVNTAYSFNGSTDYISLSPTNYINKNEFTTSAWVNPSVNPAVGKAQMIFNVGESGGDQFLGLVNNPSNGDVGWVFSSYDASSRGIYTQSRSLPVINKWYHVACTRTNSQSKLYVNGVLVDSASLGNNNAGYARNSVVRIGSRYNNTQNWKGLIDEVSVFGCAMSASEISKLYASRFCDQDTCDVTIIDTVTVNDTVPIFDTVKLTVYDTVKIQVIDTIYKTVYDTIRVFDTVFVSLEGHVGKGESDQLIVFPNPSQGIVQVKLDKTGFEISYKLHSVSGQLLKEESVGYVSDFKLKLPVDSGTYILSVYSEGELMERIKLLMD